MNDRRANVVDRMHAGSYLELILRFADWMQQRNALHTTPRDLRERFPVSYATSYRWLNAWRAAHGRPPIGAQYPNRKRTP